MTNAWPQSLLLTFTRRGGLILKGKQMPKYRKKPIVIEAVQFTGGNYDDIRCFMVSNEALFCDGEGVKIKTLEGTHIVSPHDWVIRGIKGEYYPCKPDIFEDTYEKVK